MDMMSLEHFLRQRRKSIEEMAACLLGIKMAVGKIEHTRNQIKESGTGWDINLIPGVKLKRENLIKQAALVILAHELGLDGMISVHAVSEFYETGAQGLFQYGSHEMDIIMKHFKSHH